MPTYTYQCSECGSAFEQFQKFSEDPLTVCPSCGGSIRRVMHAPGIVFKGSGWYINDSRKGGSSESSSGSSPAAAPSSSSTDSASSAPAKSTGESAPAPAPATAKAAD
jgi:putative FmdB family regulatory protein